MNSCQPNVVGPVSPNISRTHPRYIKDYTRNACNIAACCTVLTCRLSLHPSLAPQEKQSPTTQATSISKQPGVENYTRILLALCNWRRLLLVDAGNAQEFGILDKWSKCINGHKSLESSNMISFPRKCTFLGFCAPPMKGHSCHILLACSVDASRGT